MVVYKEFPTDITSKANPVDADILLIADSADNNEMKKITIGSITADIGDWLIVDGSESAATTYSSEKINDLNEAQNTLITALDTDKLEKSWQLRTGNWAWKTIYNNASWDETELTLGAATRVFTSNGATSAPSWEVPTADIVSLTEDTTWDMAADFLLAYDTSATANRKQKPQVYTASDAEIIAGTATNKWVTPKQLRDNKTVDALTFTRDLTTASGTQVINHNLGRVPVWITFGTVGISVYVTASNETVNCHWAYDGTTNNCSTTSWEAGNTSNTYCIVAESITSYSKWYQWAVTAWDSTTFTITWTKTGSPTGTFNICALVR